MGLFYLFIFWLYSTSDWITGARILSFLWGMVVLYKIWSHCSRLLCLSLIYTLNSHGLFYRAIYVLENSFNEIWIRLLFLSYYKIIWIRNNLYEICGLEVCTLVCILHNRECSHWNSMLYLLFCQHFSDRFCSISLILVNWNVIQKVWILDILGFMSKVDWYHISEGDLWLVECDYLLKEYSKD